ncbi:Uncharacterized protein APZ42_025825, partial [Daphnia magna]
MSLSNYVSGLSVEAKKKYIDKLDILQCDCPYSLSKDLWKQGLHCCTIIPKIDHGDIFAYLVFSRSVVLVQAKVTPSQAISDTPHSPWAAIGVDGCVIYAHCTCAVGLGEVCNHIGCLLLVSVYSVEIHEGKGRTEDKCTWADLSSQPGTYKEVRE